MVGTIQTKVSKREHRVYLLKDFFNDINNNIILFPSEIRHNDSFLVFTFVGCQLVLHIEKFNWMFTLKGQRNFNLKLNLDYIWTKFEGFKVFFFNA